MVAVDQPAQILARHASRALAGRWWQLLLGILCMSMIANLQYGWTLFVTPLDERFHWGRAAIQVAFTLFVVAETWLVPFEGYLVDHFGPRPVIVAGGVLVGLSWVIEAYADSLVLLYAGAAVGGVGAGAVYGTCVGNALKWFPDRRGLAAGLTAMGFGAGSALTLVPIAQAIALRGYAATFLLFGVIQGLAVFLLGWLLRAPPAGPETALACTPESLPSEHYKPWQMAATPVFWVMYAMFVMMAAGGLMATAQLGPIAHDFRIADTPVSLAGLTLPALTFALSIDRVLNGITRPFFGWVSDKIGRELTMGIAFALEGFGIMALALFGRDPIAFVILSGMVFFAWGEIYSLFPALCCDIFGPRYAAANAGLLYTAKGTAALLVPFSSLLADNGNWTSVFSAAAGLNLLASAMALLMLKPMRQRMASTSDQPKRGYP
jgi:OFA family oxalate/formate antiporter-like MFS transporter